MSNHKDQKESDRFRIRPGAPKQRDDAFISKVLRQTNKVGAKLGKTVGKVGHRPGARLGRGHVAARFAGTSLTPNARRVTIKARLVNLSKAAPRSTAAHLRYIEREGVDRLGGPGHAYGPTTDVADTAAFEERGREDRHQFRFIVSPEDAEQLDDLRTYTRHLMARMEADLGTRLDWVAVDHWNTDNPHTHVVLRGKDDTGKDLIISRDYIAEGMRHRAAELATEWLGPRTELEIQHAMQREVDQERWTGLDRTLQRVAADGLVRPETLAEPRLQRQRQMLIGRLQHLQRMGLATEQQPGIWAIHSDAEPTLRAMGERGDIIRTMQRAMSGKQRELAVFQPGEDGRAIVGRVVGKGLADELHDKGYLIVDGTDGKAHYVALPPRSELEQYPTGAVVEVKGSADVRTADRNIAALAVDGAYRTDHHLAVAQGQATPARDPHEVVAAHVRRLEALRRAGIVEREAEGVWRVPGDLTERGRQYDAQRLGGGVAVELKSHLPIERQTRMIGATWLDQQLIGGGKGLGDLGFGSEVKDALRQRADFLTEQGLAEQRGQRVVLARNLLATLRGRELVQAAKDIAIETGLEHRPITDGHRVAGIYRRSVMLVSGRYAMLDDGMGFSLVPWKPVIEKRLGLQLAATVRGGSVSWEMERPRGPSIA
ncbi:relaxase/mobilization nuclease domain-containing protein [Ralstonia pseudosolanacearum]|uniref:relaxase/mobilization nuclease domain-containing protein n=1 Tax=Ralstonia pseudosolanacearum TaxID=1310165 RepID=UPI003CF7150A